MCDWTAVGYAGIEVLLDWLALGWGIIEVLLDWLLRGRWAWAVLLLSTVFRVVVTMSCMTLDTYKISIHTSQRLHSKPPAGLFILQHGHSSLLPTHTQCRVGTSSPEDRSLVQRRRQNAQRSHGDHEKRKLPCQVSWPNNHALKMDRR
jgi:hypothetical protein